MPDAEVFGVYAPWAALTFAWAPWFLYRAWQMGWRAFLHNRAGLIMLSAMLLLGWVFTDRQYDNFNATTSDVRAWLWTIPFVAVPLWDIVTRK